jgi:adenylate cyclase, class 2
MLGALGLVIDIDFEKHCRNYRFEDLGREFLATLVQVPEIGDAAFLEVETLVAEDDLPAALDAIRHVLADLGVDPVTDLNRRYYQDLVSERRAERRSGQPSGLVRDSEPPTPVGRGS